MNQVLGVLLSPNGFCKIQYVIITACSNQLKNVEMLSKRAQTSDADHWSNKKFSLISAADEFAFIAEGV